MKVRLLIIAVLASIVLVACSKPMENKDLANQSRDDSAKAMKKAGADDSTP